MPYSRDPWAVPRRDRWTSWQAELSGTNEAPTLLGALLALVVVALLALALAGGPRALAAPRGRPGGFESPSCVELARLNRVRAPHDRTWRATGQACSRSRQAVPGP